MAVGIESFNHLGRAQAGRLSDAERSGEQPILRHWTRNTPVRADEVCGGGSLYWIIKGAIRARQRITAIENSVSEKSRKRCAFILDPSLVQTAVKPTRAIQGWRYLDVDAAPKDLVGRAKDGGDLPEEMAQELRELGLL